MFPKGFALVFVAHTNDDLSNQTDILALSASLKDPRIKTMKLIITN